MTAFLERAKARELYYRGKGDHGRVLKATFNVAKLGKLSTQQTVAKAIGAHSHPRTVQGIIVPKLLPHKPERRAKYADLSLTACQ